MVATSINSAEVLRRMLTTHGLASLHPGSKELVDHVLAEYLRRSLRAFTSGQDGASTPVYVTKLTNAARRQLAPLWPQLYSFRDQAPSTADQEAEGDLHPDRVRRVLERLSDLRDVAELGDGYWLPAPVRLVSLPGQDQALVIGGVGTVELSRLLSAAVQHVGVTRVVRSSTLPKAIQVDPHWWQSYSDWCGEPPVDLREWTQGLIANGAKNMAVSASDYNSFEVYAPWLKPTQPQYFRWLRFDTLLNEGEPTIKGLVLCRSLPGRIKMPRKYWLGHIQRGTLRSEAPVQAAQVRRLQYGLDLLSSAPTRVICDADGSVTLRSGLPPEEQRPLFAFGRDVSPHPGRFPLKYMIDPNWQHLIHELLQGLGIEVFKK